MELSLVSSQRKLTKEDIPQGNRDLKMQVKKKSRSSYPGLMERKIRGSSQNCFLATTHFNSIININSQEMYPLGLKWQILTYPFP